MAKHIVKCKYCNIEFDANVEEFVKINTRYAHLKCRKAYEETKTKEELDYEELEQYIKQLFKIPQLTARITKQIRDFKDEYNYTYSGMRQTLVWWYEIEGNDLSKANQGIGIIPYIYEQAYDYYYSLFLSQTINSIQDIEKFEIRIEEIEIAAPQPPPRKVKLFNLS